jgi:hypothetical protein
MALTPPEVEELHVSVENLLRIWMKIKLAMQKAFGKDGLAKEHETAFTQLKSELLRVNRTLAERLPKDLSFEAEQMVEMMKNATTMQHLRGLPVAEKRKQFGDWHRIYVLMQRTFGALDVMKEGYYPSLHRALMLPREKRAKAKGRRAKKR